MPVSQYADELGDAVRRLLSPVGELPTATPRVHAGVQFDPAHGLGGVPDAANADYRGFMAYMLPKQFLQVNPPRNLELQSIDHILRAIDNREPIGTPILYVDRGPNAGWQVRGHEGRGRMHALQQISPDSYFPVAVHPYGGIRASDLNADDALAWMRPDTGGDLPARPALSILHQRPYVQPRDAEFLQQHGRHPALQQLIKELSQ